jgi:hypothetical protein
LINSVVYKISLLFLALFLLKAPSVFCQVDTTTKPSAMFDSTKPRVAVDTLEKVASPAVANKAKIDSALRLHSPKKAAIRSALIPGWGQAYNKKYWKIPIIYGALGVCAGVFVYNLTNYEDLRYAYKAKYNYQTYGDTSGLSQIKPELVNLDLGALRTNRDEFRRNIDYSALFFILLWGLNVVDAAVDAHLKSFDVSPDLSLKFKPGRSQMAGTTGLSVVLAFK